MELASKYDPQSVEAKWYEYWLNNKLFSSKPDGREPYTVVIPPPNVTGVLHMGHMLNNTIQDILVRHARMEGKNACWVPGTDHASIATEAKVVNRLAQEGINKTDLSRDEFLKHAWKWTDEHGGIILKQLRKLGCSCDWDRTAFTMDEKRSRSVIKVFCDLYNKGLIYRGVRMVNWDPSAETALSDEEVVYKDEHSKLYNLKYYISPEEQSRVERKCDDNVIHKDDKGYYAVVATTRPETIMGDTAMCINPDDVKNTWLKGLHVIVPLVGRRIPVIEDTYVDIQFGTGCLKVTPAHDINDHALGLKHGLETIDIFNDNGTLSNAAGLYIGQDRMDVRKQIAIDLEAANLMEKIEDYDNKVGYSERTNVPIEPKLSTQWFLRMQHFADIALNPVLNDEIEFYPKKYKNTYRHWLENIKDWCISRQLWWGHRIPAYYFKDTNGKTITVVAENNEKAFEQAKLINPNLTVADLEQESDCLDTWFSSWLWPISVFDGINNPDNEEIKYYYPTSDLVTGPDIIFFWVARMIMAGLEWRGKVPFKNVYFTGIVRDKQRRKMSKSLGNSPDPLELIDKYGADSVRVGILLSSAAGNDLLFDEDLMLQGRNFATKIYNAFKLTQSWTKEAKPAGEAEKQTIVWFENQMNKTISEINDQFEKFRISDALHLLYKLIWDDFCSWYLEAVKPNFGESISQEVYDQTIKFFEELMRLLHPFMPFLTEELYQHIAERNTSEALVIAQQKNAESFDENIISAFDTAKEIISGVRNYRQSKGISPREEVEVFTSESSFANENVIRKLANISEIHYSEKTDKPSFTFLVGAMEISVPLSENLDLGEEKKKTEEELAYLKGFLVSVEKKLSNEKFVANAKPEIVETERKKQKDTLEKIAILEEKLKSL